MNKLLATAVATTTLLVSGCSQPDAMGLKESHKVRSVRVTKTHLTKRVNAKLPFWREEETTWSDNRQIGVYIREGACQGSPPELNVPLVGVDVANCLTIDDVQQKTREEVAIYPGARVKSISRDAKRVLVSTDEEGMLWDLTTQYHLVDTERKKITSLFQEHYDADLNHANAGAVPRIANYPNISQLWMVGDGTKIAIDVRNHIKETEFRHDLHLYDTTTRKSLLILRPGEKPRGSNDDIQYCSASAHSPVLSDDGNHFFVLIGADHLGAYDLQKKLFKEVRICAESNLLGTCWCAYSERSATLDNSRTCPDSRGIESVVAAEDGYDITFWEEVEKKDPYFRHRTPTKISRSTYKLRR